MKKYVYIVVLLILGGGGFFFFSEEEKPSRFSEVDESSKNIYFGSFYKEQSYSFFITMERKIVLYEQKDLQKAVQSYEEYMDWLHDYWVCNGNKINFFSDFIRGQYHSFREQKRDSSLSFKKENYPTEFWKWLDSPIRKNITYGDLDPSQDRLYSDLAARSLRGGVLSYELYKELNPKEASEDLGIMDLRRAMAKYSFYYYLLLRAGEIEKSPVYESAVFYVYKKSKELGFSQYYEDPLPSSIGFPGKLGELFGSLEYTSVPDPYAGMSERKYKKLVKAFLQFLKEGEEKE